MSRMFTNGPGDRDSIPGWVIPKTQKKWFLILPCFPLHLGVVAIEKGNAGSPLIKIIIDKAKELCLPYYLPIAGCGEKRLIHAYLKGISMKWNVKSLVQDLNLVYRLHYPMTLILTLSVTWHINK